MKWNMYGICRLGWVTFVKLWLWLMNEIDIMCSNMFNVSLSNGIWNELIRMINVSLSESWDQITNEVKTLPSNKIFEAL
jgi:hypothetical protein